jgi:hypothetical protein
MDIGLSPVQSLSPDQSLDTVADEEDDDENAVEDKDDYSSSAEVALTVAKSSPLLTISSEAVGAMTATDVTELTRQHAGMQLIQKIILSSVQLALADLQSQSTGAHQIINEQALAHESIVAQFQQMQVPAQQT